MLVITSVKLVGLFVRKDNMFFIEVPKYVIRVAELNGVRIADKVRAKVRIIRGDSSVDVDVKVYVYGSADVCRLLLPHQVARDLGVSVGSEVVFEVVK